MDPKAAANITCKQPWHYNRAGQRNNLTVNNKLAAVDGPLVAVTSGLASTSSCYKLLTLN